jgi:hypothetical protein
MSIKFVGDLPPEGKRGAAGIGYRSAFDRLR